MPGGLLHFDHRMTDSEALMWKIDGDPWLISNIVGINVLDRQLDFADFRRRMANAAAQIPRLRQRVQPGLGGLTAPTWVTDPEFDIDYHLRRMALPKPGNLRQLFDIAADLMQDPFDRTRPLWQYTIFDGVEGERSAMFSKLHHTMGDATMAIEVAAQYLSPNREQPPPDSIDLEELIRSETAERGDLVTQIMNAGGSLTRLGVDAVAGAAGEIGETLSNPARIGSKWRELVDNVRVTSVQLSATLSKASPLWSQRSRHRRIEVFELPFEASKETAKRLGGKLNDFFVTGAVEGAARYHEVMASPIQVFTVSFAIDTRSGSSADSPGNDFTIVPVELLAGPMKLEDRFTAVHERLEELQNVVRGGGGLNALAGVVNLLPTSVVTTSARNRAAHIDFATSNAAAAPFPLFMSGAEVKAIIPVGPVAGTAFNQTMLSYNGTLFVGMNIDTRAVDEPALLHSLMKDSYRDLINLGSNDSAAQRP